MSEHQHRWVMTNVRFGFIAFEKCYHCNRVRTFFFADENPDLSDEYREGNCYWTRVENAQSVMFDLQCSECGRIEKFDDLMGILHCTGCLAECDVEKYQQSLAAQKTWVMVAFSFLGQNGSAPILEHRLEILAEHFNQRRDTTRSRITFVPSSMINDLSRCRGDFIHDIGMLSPEPVQDRKPLL